MKEIKKGNIVRYKNIEAKVVGISIKAGKTKYKLRLFDGFDTIAYNIGKNEISKQTKGGN